MAHLQVLVQLLLQVPLLPRSSTFLSLLLFLLAALTDPAGSSLLVPPTHNAATSSQHDHIRGASMDPRPKGRSFFDKSSQRFVFVASQRVPHKIVETLLVEDPVPVFLRRGHAVGLLLPSLVLSKENLLLGLVNFLLSALRAQFVGRWGLALSLPLFLKFRRVLGKELEMLLHFVLQELQLLVHIHLPCLSASSVFLQRALQ